MTTYLYGQKSTGQVIFWSGSWSKSLSGSWSGSWLEKRLIPRSGSWSGGWSYSWSESGSKWGRSRKSSAGLGAYGGPPMAPLDYLL